jgi:hypothetical protein
MKIQRQVIGLEWNPGAAGARIPGFSAELFHLR